MSARSTYDVPYYRALALKRLGRIREAEEVLRCIRAAAETLEAQKVEIDYFATSLPAMLLFVDDLKKPNAVAATFLRAQACLGFGEIAKAKQLIGEVLRLDRNHAPANELLAELEANLPARRAKAVYAQTRQRIAIGRSPAKKLRCEEIGRTE